MKLTTHYEDGSTQTFDVPEWARWVEYMSDGGVWVWEKKPTLIHKQCGFYDADKNKSNNCSARGAMKWKQLKDHTLTLQRIEFV